MVFAQQRMTFSYILSSGKPAVYTAYILSIALH